MSMAMSNIDKGGFVPPGFGAGYSSAPNVPSAPPVTGQPGSSIENQLFLFGPPAGYTPVPTMPPYDTAQYGGDPAHPQYGGGSAQPQYGGGAVQPQYGGGAVQPQYGGSGQFYDGGGRQAHYMPDPYSGGNPQGPYSGRMPPGYGGPTAPIVTQPGIQPQPGQPFGPGEWMSIPAGIRNCPRGLEYLTTVDQLLVKQKVELLEVFTGFETTNKYTVKNILGQKVYYAIEENDCCTRNLCGANRAFEMRIFDNFRNEVLHLHRPLACTSCLFPCCLQTMEVSSPPGNVIGSIEQNWTICKSSFAIKDHLGDVVLRIEGPFCTLSICGDVEFSVVTLTGESIGKISKQWSGLAREIFTDADFFGINFPMDLDVRIKAVLLGACFLIDFMFFENQPNRDGGML